MQLAFAVCLLFGVNDGRSKAVFDGGDAVIIGDLVRLMCRLPVVFCRSSPRPRVKEYWTLNK